MTVFLPTTLSDPFAIAHEGKVWVRFGSTMHLPASPLDVNEWRAFLQRHDRASDPDAQAMYQSIIKAEKQAEEQRKETAQ